MKKWIGLILVFFVLLSLDQISKFLSYLYLPKMGLPIYPFGGIGLFKFGNVSLSLNYVENSGAAWGVLADYSNYLFYLRLLIVLILVIYLISKRLNFYKSLPYCLIIAGAIGNILDYLFYDHVIDMIYFIFFSYSYPVFNLADSMICIGIGWLLIDSFITSKKFRSSQ